MTHQRPQENNKNSLTNWIFLHRLLETIAKSPILFDCFFMKQHNKLNNYFFQEHVFILLGYAFKLKIGGEEGLICNI